MVDEIEVSDKIFIVILILLCCTICTAAQAVIMDWVVVTDAGNTADDQIMTTDSTWGYGNLNYEYKIGKYEVTNGQYCEFLNNVAVNDIYGLFEPLMETSLYGGIMRSGNPGAYVYTVKEGYGNLPVNYVNWEDCIRFCNWMHNGQGDGSTENGAYTILNGGINNGFYAMRNPEAEVFLPNENEWYKAAYYKGGSLDAGYWDFATQNNNCPTSEIPPGSNNSANFYDGQYAIENIHLSEVGAYIDSRSFYGTYDQNGNVLEWLDSWTEGYGMGLRGGSWASGGSIMQSDYRFGAVPATYGSGIGFRIAAVIPEPATIFLLGLGFLTLKTRFYFKESANPYTVRKG